MLANGLRVLVTAGAQGIGLAIAQAFVDAGARVHVCDSNKVAVDAIATGTRAITATSCDVTDRSAVEAMYGDAIRSLGGLDALINNAGVSGPTGRVDRISPEDWDRTLSVNITGQYNCTRLAVPDLIKSECPSILCMSSSAGRVAFPNRAPYAASKWAVIGFMKTIAAELGEHGIRVNAILPGMVDGPRLQSVLAAKAEAAGLEASEIVERGLAGTAIKRLVEAKDVASLAVFLASPGGRAISGQAIGVDNGLQYMV